MAITSLLDLTFAPGAVAGARQVLHEVLAATRAFPGCRGVEVLVDLDDPAHVVLHETWESVDADAAYRAWRATPEGASGLEDLLTRPPALTRLAAAPDV